MNVFEKLIELLPVLAQIKGGKNVELAVQLVNIAEEEISRRMQQHSKSRTEVLMDADRDWKAAVEGADDLAALGHEDD